MTYYPGPPTYLYKFYDAAAVLLYIGIAGDLKVRWRTHAATKPWWPEVARRTAVLYPTAEAADNAERDAVKAEHPVYNATYNLPRIRTEQAWTEGDTSYCYVDCRFCPGRHVHDITTGSRRRVCRETGTAYLVVARFSHNYRNADPERKQKMAEQMRENANQPR